MANLSDFMRQELAAIRAMAELQRSLTGTIAFSVPKITLTQDVLGDARIKMVMRDALDHCKMADVAARIVAPSLLPSNHISSLLGSLRPALDLVRQAAPMHETWRRLMAPDQLKLIDFAPPALGAHLASISRVAESARMLRALIPSDTIGRALDASASVRGALTARLDRLSMAYGAFYADVAKSEEAVLALPPALSAQPALEYFAAVNLAAATTRTEVDPVSRDELDATRSHIEAETDEALTASLSDRFPDLLDLLEGARAAFAAKQPDYVRHFTTSLRELFTHVLHRLAPDVEVREFGTNPEDFANGKPTRGARLRYICKNVNTGRFTDFVKKDVAAMLAFADLFQAGTHEVKSVYTVSQLRALLVRMEGVVRFLLEINETEQGPP
jgi:Predicted pPIWI-associating nuclease